MTSSIRQIRKRDGRIVKFDKEKIEKAIQKALIATKSGGEKIARKLTSQVIKILENRFTPSSEEKGEIPTVEQVQDVVEDVLIANDYAQTAKAYILYRERHKEIREMRTIPKKALGLIDSYLNKSDWEIKENSNMSYSLQGLNNYITSYISRDYWLNKIYSSEARKAAQRGDFHIHDLQILAPYCMGWDLYDLLVRGFGGVPGKVESRPAKHFSVILGQIVNFFYTLQGEAAGAQAFSNFDTLLAPFIYYDNLSPKQIKQSLQEFVYNCNVPTRVGFQCVSEDTDILTPTGWKSYNEVNKGDIIRTFNLKKGVIENKKVQEVFRRKYNGVMYNLKNRIQDQLVSPRHKVVRKKFRTGQFILEPVEKVVGMKSPFIIPVSAGNSNQEAKISDEQIKLMAWIIGEGSVEKPGKNYRSCYRISIYQSAIKNRGNYREIKSLLDNFHLQYSEYTQKGLGQPVQRLRLNAESSRIIHGWFGTRETVKFIPLVLLNMGQRQSRLFINTYLEAEGFENCKIVTTDPEILDGLQIIAFNAGYGSTVLIRKPTIGTKPLYVLRLIKHQETYINTVKKVKYSGVIWSVHTENETIIARRNGKVFITGNTPYTNLSLDLTVPSFYKEQPVVIGGKTQNKTYGEFQEQMDLLNKIFAEVMSEGDAKGRPFTFPIPTYSITKDFNWNNRMLDSVWAMTAKYGIPYFSNFVNSDLNPEDVRSMCCHLRLDNRELYKRGGGLFGSAPLTGSIGVVTINLPRIGYLSKNEKEFFERLAYLMDLAKESLETKRKVVEKFAEIGLYPYSCHYLESAKRMRGSYFGNHFSTIGLLGGNEACLNFKPIRDTIGSKAGKKFMERVLDFMRSKLIEYQKETDNLYNLEASPAEGASYSLAKMDKERYHDIITAGTEDRPYYTNSTTLPVNFTDDLFKALKLQDNLQTKYTGGTVFHIFLGESLYDPNQAKKLVKAVVTNFHAPYFTLTPIFSICPGIGYIPGEHHFCPDSTVKIPCEVYSRVVGYLRPVSQWNTGKQEEFAQRKMFGVENKKPPK